MTSATGIPIVPRPCSAADAVTRARALVGHGVYELGTGDWNTPADDPTDCAGFAIDKCYQVPRHRPGFNRGNPCGIDDWDVEDDLNSNSALADAFGAQDLFTVVGSLAATTSPVIMPQVGDLLAYPTIRITDAHGELHVFVGHIVVVVGVDRWDGTWGSLDIVQSCGPNGRKPGIIASTGAHFDDYAKTWPLKQHRPWLLRIKP